MNNLRELPDEELLNEAQGTHKLRIECGVIILCHIIWVVAHFVFDLAKTGAIHPHIIVAAIGGLSYHAGELFKTDIHLFNLRRQIAVRGLDRRGLTTRDYLEVVATGIAAGFGFCGAVEVLDLAFSGHVAGSRSYFTIYIPSL